MPKKSAKAALKQKQKQKAKQKDKPKSKNEKQNVDTKLQATNEVLAQIDNPNRRIKEFNRDVHIPDFTLQPIGGGPPLIKSSDVKLIHGHRYGLVGYNGAGKTTFLQKLASRTLKEIPNYLRILHVHQELEGSNLTVMEAVLKADKEREILLQEEKRLRLILEAEDSENKNENENNNTNTNENKNETNDNDNDNANENDNVNENEENPNENENNNENDDAQNTNNDNETKNEDKKNKRKNKNQNNTNNSINIEQYTNKLLEIHDRLKFIEADTAESRASSVLDGLQFTDRMKNMKTSDLSGGWRMRVSLACALFVEPDILLLDEPTNHLDFPSVIWLSEYIAHCYPQDKTVVIVSHDRRFLNDTCTDIMHLDRNRLFFYKGNYESFMKVRQDMRIHQARQYERQQKMIKHNEEFISRFKANKKWSSQAQSRMKLLTRLNRIEKVLGDLEFRFSFPNPPPLKNPLLFHLDDVTFGYFGEDNTGNTYLLKDINLRLEYGTKVGILGANGAGKSTLLRLIMQEIEPLKGTAALSNAVEVGYFAQHHVETLDYTATPMEHLKHVFGDATVQEIYAQLGRFNLGDKFARRKIGELSGGQKSRVAFSILTWYAPHLIIMDEPTNHLDMPTIDALSIALADYEGSVLIVSHDQYFVETVCDEYWAVGNREVRQFDDFEKCREYTSKQCKPIDVLPREFSTQEIKKKNFALRHVNKHIDNENKNNNVDNNEKKEDIFVVDWEREIDRGMEKGLSPNMILTHIRGWKPTDGDRAIVDKLGFIMFDAYFDKKSESCEVHEFFERWSSLICYCIPPEHINNQCVLIDVAYACFRTAFGDNHSRAVQTYGFGTMIEGMFNSNMITLNAAKQWLTNNKSKGIKEAVEQLSSWIDEMENQNGNDSS